MLTTEIERDTKKLIDDLKGICTNAGMGGSGDEYRVMTQVFLYKFLNDKFSFEIKNLDKSLEKSGDWESALAQLSDKDYQLLTKRLKPGTARLQRHHLFSFLFEKQNEPNFSKLFDETLREIATENHGIFSVMTQGGAKEPIFENITEYIRDHSKRDGFCKSIINKLVNFSFETIFNQKYDFFATIFEYLVKDYNQDSGGAYAEYYTPNAVARIIGSILVPEDEQGVVKDVSVYDPSAGSGTLLMSVAHAIGEDRCTIFSQDISQKSSNFLRLNLILNNLVHSIQNVIQGNTILDPFHRDGKELKKFDYIVSNPPFKMDFSDYRDDLDTKENNERFFAGIPNIPKKKKEGMAIYQLFLQHIIASLKEGGKAAIVVPTGFIAAQQGIDKKIRQKLVDERLISGVVSLPSNIFATTGTNVSVLFIDSKKNDNVVLIDASNLGKKVKEGKNQRTVLEAKEEKQIITTFNQRLRQEDFAIVVTHEEVKAKLYSLNVGQYFDVKIDYLDLNKQDFDTKINDLILDLDRFETESKSYQEEIKDKLKSLRFNSE